MQYFLSLVLLSAAVTAGPVVHGKRQQASDSPTTWYAPAELGLSTNAAEFSSAANQLVSLYIPASVAVPLGVAVQSAASAQGITGDINSIVQSALTATSAPSFLTAIPSQYQSNIVSLESAISALRGAANTGIAGASRVVTSTNSAGSEVVTTQPPSAVVVGGVVVTTTNSAGKTITSTVSGGSSARGSVITTTDSAGNTITSTASGSSASASGSSASSSASASASVSLSFLYCSRPCSASPVGNRL
jgi:hypothetical protein